MASVIKLKRSSTVGAVPTTSQIAEGEIALNTADQKLYSANSTAVFQIHTGGVKSRISRTNSSRRLDTRFFSCH